MIAWGRGDARASGIVLGVHGGDTVAPHGRSLTISIRSSSRITCSVRLAGLSRILVLPLNSSPLSSSKTARTRLSCGGTRDLKLYYVAVGEELETGVVVEKVERRSVALRKNGESKVYRLKWE